jgi:predicted ATPase
VAERGGARRPDGIEPPFVGRAEELRFLKEQFHTTGREGKARLVSLVGQAGIGKSRLAWELEKYLDGVVEQVWWHRGRSPSYGEGVTFWALSEMFRRRAGLAEGDDAETTRRAVTAMLKQHVPDEAERAWIEPRILVLLGVGDATQGGSAELFAAWRTFFERVATTGTVAIVIEDLQWSDDGLLDFLEHLLDWGRSSPIFVLTLARPEILDRRPGWGTDRRGATAMRLDPLSDSAMRELLDGIAPGLPEKVVARILERADGIPLYAVETVRMLVAKGQLVEQDGQFVRVADDAGAALSLTGLEVPPTLQALVAARLDALPPADRSLLQDAAVIGQSFTLEALAAIHQQPIDGLRPRLAALVRREILTLETDPRAPTRGQHAFVQALLREVAFSTLSKRERRARHLAAARYFESLGDDEVAGAIATHFVEAYRAAPEGPEGEAVATQARISLLATAERAHGLGAMRQAIDLLGSALEVTADPAQRARLLEQLGNLEVDHSDWEAAFATLRTAIEAYAALGDRIGVIRSSTYLARAYLGPSRITEAAEIVRDIREEGEALIALTLERGAHADVQASEAGALFAEAMARFSFRSQEHPEAIRWASRAIALAEPLRLDEIFCQALVTKATTMSMATNRREGLALLEGAILDATAHGIHTAALRGLNNLSSSIGDIDPRAALDKVRQGMATSRRLGLRSFEYYQASNGVGASEPLGEWAWLQETVETMLGDERDEGEGAELVAIRDYFTCWTGNPNLVAGEARLQAAIRDGDYQAERAHAAFLSRCAFAVGDHAKAIELSDQWFRLVERNTFSFDFGMVARFALHGGRVDLATRALEVVGAGVGGKADHTLQAVRAGIAALEGNRDEAIALYRAAFAGFRSYGVKFELALTILDMATFLGSDDPSVKPLVDESRQILTDLGANPLLDRLAALETRPKALRAADQVSASRS